MFSTIKIVSVVVTIGRQAVFRCDLFHIVSFKKISFQQFKYLSNELKQFYSSTKKTFFRVQVLVWQNDGVLSSSLP